jgi:uncharacterized protein YgfB (UPF0149 family)
MSEVADFASVSQALAAAGGTVGAAEAHGCLCGAACARRDYGLAEWLDEIVPDGADVDRAVLASLRAGSMDALGGDGMDFRPLLPDDEQPLQERVEALATWCQGFLYGFGAAGTAGTAVAPEVAEVLTDLSRISQAGSVGADEAETEEASYAELVEFLRAAVQLVYEDLAALRASQPEASAAD